MIVPYVTTWSEEVDHPGLIVERRRLGIAYADETFLDRDDRGVLWRRIPSRPGNGRPMFGKIHSLRQRRAQRRMLCQICAGPADTNEQGTLWLIPDADEEWRGDPEGMAATEPPICMPCARESIKLCPTLRKRHILVRVGRCPLNGVFGVRYRPGPGYPIAIDATVFGFDDPAIRWVCAGQLIRELFDCVPVELS